MGILVVGRSPTLEMPQMKKIHCTNAFLRFVARPKREEEKNTPLSNCNLVISVDMQVDSWTGLLLINDGERVQVSRKPRPKGNSPMPPSLIASFRFSLAKLRISSS